MRARYAVAIAIAVAGLGCAEPRICDEWVDHAAPWSAGSCIDPPEGTREPAHWTDRDASRPDPVWGAADLHAHLAAHLAMGGGPDGSGGILFGTPEQGGLECGRITIGPEESCDGETHSRAALDPATRLTQSVIFSLFGDEGRRAHTPMFASSTCGDADFGLATGPFAHWPHAQDLYHQQMYITQIRRAWEGGLRLMFAAAGSTQTLAQAMSITLAPGPVEIDLSQEREMAERQRAYIVDLVSRPENRWMEIAYSPQDAREIIRRGHLAIVLSLEMDWLSAADVTALHALGFRHIIPIHVADNPVGGAAAYSNVFNLHQRIFHGAVFPSEGQRFYDLVSDECVQRRLEAPLRAELIGGLLLFPGRVGADELATLGYADPTFACDVDGSPITHTGTRNLHGLGASGEDYLRHLMRLGMIIDVTHMSLASAAGAMRLSEQLRYPVIDGHTGVARPGEVVGEDRSLSFDVARRMYRNQRGVIGLGTGGGNARVLRTLFRARSTWSLRPGDVLALPVQTLPVGEHSPAVEHPATTAVTGSQVCLAGASSDGAPRGHVLVRWCRPVPGAEPDDPELERSLDGAWARLPLVPDDAGSTTSCTPSLRIEPGTSIASLRYERALDPVCAEAPSARPNVRSAFVRTGSATVTFELPVHAGDGLTSDLDLDSVVCPQHYACDDPVSAEPVLPAIPRARSGLAAVHDEQRILRFHATGASADFEWRVRGASYAYAGVNVIVTVGLDVVGADESLRRSIARSVTLNHRGLWTGETPFEEYLVVSDLGADDSLRVTSVNVALTDEDGGGYAWALGELRIEEIEDPILAWARNYEELRDEIRAARSGALPRPGGEAPRDAIELTDDEVVFAIGTDLNGYAPQFWVSALDPDMSAYGGNFRVCDPRGRCVELRLNERGMAGYGMLADFFEALRDRAPGVRDALMSSAEATIRSWELADARARELRGEAP